MIDVKNADGTKRVSVTKVFAALLVLIGAYRTIALTFGIDGPPAGLEDRIQSIYDSIWPLVSLVGAALWGQRRAVEPTK